MPSQVLDLARLPILAPASMYPPFCWEELYEKIEWHLEKLPVSKLWSEMTDRYYASMKERALSGDRNRLMWTVRDFWRSTVTSAVWAHDRQTHEPNGPTSLGMGSEFRQLQWNVNAYIERKLVVEESVMRMTTIAEEEEDILGDAQGGGN